VAAHEAREPYTCKAIGCGQAFRKHATLQAHVASVHEGKAPYICTEIGIHGGPCSDGFETAAKLKYHKNRVHGAAKYWCTLCGDETHQSNGQEEENITNSPSGVPFSSYNAFQAHKRAVHPLKCTSCGYQTGFPGDLNRHCEIHHGNQDLAEGMTHHCIESDCERSFTRRGNLLIHMKIAHAQGKPYVCGAVDLSELNRIANWSGQDACGRGFASKQGLEKHIQIAHLCLDKNKIGEVNNIRPRNQKAPALARLTGTSKVKHLSIACLRLDCDKRFSVEYEHEMHLQSAHGMADFEIQYLRSEHNDHSLSTYGEWLTRKDDAEIQRTLNDQLTSTPMDQDTRTTLQENTEIALDRAAGLGGQFWVGGVGLENMEEIDWDAEERAMRSMNEENQWEADAREMRLLIREDGSIDDMAIDPNLG
jgi:general transcription factor IIIA